MYAGILAFTKFYFTDAFSYCFCLKRPSLICLFHFTKRYVSISNLFIICCSLSLSFTLSVSLYLYLSLNLALLWIIGNPCIIFQNYLFLSLSLFLPLSPSLSKISLLLHLMQIYGRFRPCFKLLITKKNMFLCLELSS